MAGAGGGRPLQRPRRRLWHAAPGVTAPPDGRNGQPGSNVALPTPPTSLIGRESELAQARTLLDPSATTTWSALRQITCPTLLVRGAESDILSPELAQRMVQAIPNCRLVEVPNSGHSVPLDNPSGFLAAVRTFL
jgi:pimeloyl-ACP methyl ester carboxylesterase